MKINGIGRWLLTVLAVLFLWEAFWNPVFCNSVCVKAASEKVPETSSEETSQEEMTSAEKQLTGQLELTDLQDMVDATVSYTHLRAHET